MVRDQTRSGPGVVEWSLPDDEVGDVRALVPFSDEDLDPDDASTTWCPVCTEHSTMRAVVTPSGRRFDLCDGCGLLLHVDRALGRVVAHRVAAPPRAVGRDPVAEAGDVPAAGHAPPASEDSDASGDPGSLDLRRPSVSPAIDDRRPLVGAATAGAAPAAGAPRGGRRRGRPGHRTRARRAGSRRRT